MTGTELQEKLDAIVTDLQTTQTGKTTQIAFRAPDGAMAILPLSSTVGGVVDVNELKTIQDQLDVLMPIADTFTAETIPVSAASEAFRLARLPHQPLIDAASAARVALQTAFDNDGIYTDAKEDYDDARVNPLYLAARTAYQANNVSENYGNLSDARGNYF